MRPLPSFCLLLLLTCAVGAQELNRTAEPVPKRTENWEGRFLFPRNFARGFIDFQIAPPHNEVDLGVCFGANNSSLPPGAACTGFARYVWSGYLEVQPFGRSPLRRLFLFTEPKLFGGNNLPQRRYGASGELILFEQTLGMGIKLPGQLEARLTNHQVKMLGRYSRAAFGTLNTDGPYGLYTTVGVRWYFGGWNGTRLPE